MYKVGDKVRIVNLNNTYYPWNCFAYFGEVVTIKEIVHEPNEYVQGVYHMEEDGGTWFWGGNALEKVEE